MSKRFDAYFDDLTSCSLLGFLEQKRPTEKNKAYSVYKGVLVSIANDDTSKPERRAFAQACINSFEEQTNSVPVEQYWMDLAKYKLENEIYLEESQHVLDATKDTREQGLLLRKTITKRFEKRSASEVEEKSDDFMPVCPPKKKKNLSLSKAKTTKDTPSSSRATLPEPPSSRATLPEPPSSRSEMPIGTESAGSSRGATKKTSGINEVNSLGYDRPRTPPRQIQQSTSRNQDLIRRLREEKLRNKSQIEPICSNIVDTTNKHLMERLQLNHDYHWEPIINDTTKYIDELIESSDSRSNLRQKLQVSFVPSGETYSFDKYYEMSWVHRFADKLLSLFEAPRNPLLDKNSEGWINCHLLALLIDDCFLTCEEIQVHRCEEMSLASIMRKNIPREESEKKKSGHKIDIIFRIDDMEYFGAETFTDEDPHNSKPISYKHKLFREMKDQLDRLLKKLKFTKETIKMVKNIVLHGISHGGYNGTMYAMYYDVDIGYYYVFESCQYRIGTTLRSVPESLVALKDVLRLKNDIIGVLEVVDKVKKIALRTNSKELFTIENLPETTPTPKKTQKE